MANEATIDELQIEISASSASAASNLDTLANALDRLQAITSRITGGSDGLNKVAKQIEKLDAISQKIKSMQGFEKLGKMVDQLSKLDRLSRISDFSGFIRNANKLPPVMNALAQMPSIDGSRFQRLADALKPLQSANASGINSLMNALRKLPKLSQELSGVDFTRLTQQIEQISRAIEPLTRQAERAGQGLTAIAQIMQRTSRQARQSASGFGLLNQTIGNIKVKTLAAFAALRRLFSALKSGVTASAAYVENLNLFSVTMGESADEALRFAESVNAALGVDTSDWIRYQGVFQSIGKGFGIVSEKADVMSKNLTQMSYDLSSFYNISVDTAAMKLQSAMSGEIMPMRQLGFAIDEATLKQVALNHGIEMSVENMTQAQKAQLRYVAIMEQAGNIGALGDMARTIDTAANGMRVFEARIQQFSRAVGNMLMPMLSAVLPYATAFVQVLTEGAQAIANLFGFELPKIDFSGAQVTSGFDDITGAIDEATEANEKFKGSLASIDQLNIIGSESESKNGSGSGNSFDLGIELPEYDFLQGVESKTKRIAEDIKDWFKEALPWIEAVGAAIGTVFLASKVNSFIGFLDKVKEAMITIGGLVSGKFGKAAQIFSGIAGGLAAGASSGILFYNGIKNLITGTGDLAGNWVKVGAGAAVAGGVIAAFIALGNPVGAVITGIGAAIGILSGVIVGIEEKQREMNRQIADSIMYAENGGIAIEGLADGFSGYFDEITSHYDDVLASTRAFEDNKSKISGAAGEIYNLTEKYGALGGAMTEEDALTLSNNIKIIGDSISTNLGTATQTIVDALKNKFSDFAKQLGLDVDDMVGKFYLLQSMGNTALADIQKHAQELAVEISQSETIDPTKLKELDDTVKKMSITTSATAESIGFERALKEMDFAGIDFASPESVKQAITDFESKKIEAESTINKAWDAQLLQLQNTKEQYISLGVNAKFDEKFGSGTFDALFSDAEKTLNMGYKSELDKIATGYNVFLAMVDQQFKSNKQSAFENTPYTIAEYNAADWNSYWKLGLTRTDKDLQDYLKIEHQKTIDEQFSPIQEIIDQSAKGVDLTQYYDVGKSLLQGMTNGTIENADGLYKALDGIAAGAIDTTKDALGVHSPSTIFAGIGGNTMQGLANGIIENQNLVFSALDYVVVESIMRLSKLKENMGIKIGKVDTAKIITESEAAAGIAATSSALGDTTSNIDYENVRKAVSNSNGEYSQSYSQATQSSSNGTDVMEANLTIYNYLEMDGDIIAEKVEERRVDMQRRMNGR